MDNLPDIDNLVSQLFSGIWAPLPLSGPFTFADLEFPGVYLLAYSDQNLEGASIDPHDIFYVGMSNNASGICKRLNQFRTGLEKNNSHSGAMRFYSSKEYCGGHPFSKLQTNKRFYFTLLTIPCISNKKTAKACDFKKMGHVTCLEYYTIARIIELTGRKPSLNKLGK